MRGGEPRQRYYCFGLDENYEVGEVDAAVKAGTSNWVGQVEGSVCGTTSLKLPSIVAAPSAPDWPRPILVGFILVSLFSVGGIARRQPRSANS